MGERKDPQGPAIPATDAEWRERIRTLSGRGTWEAYVEMTVLWPHVPVSLLAVWRLAVDDCLRRWRASRKERGKEP